MVNSMTPDEQVRFIRELTTAINRELLANIRSGRIPEEWDGIELRQLMADRYARAVFVLSRSRKAAYNNTVLVNNL